MKCSEICSWVKKFSRAYEDMDLCKGNHIHFNQFGSASRASAICKAEEFMKTLHGPEGKIELERTTMFFGYC